jgi:hypothetical protein
MISCRDLAYCNSVGLVDTVFHLSNLIIVLLMLVLPAYKR